MPYVEFAGQRWHIPATERAIRLTSTPDGTELFAVDAQGNLRSSSITNGLIPLPLGDAHLAAYGAIAVSGGVLATDTNPAIARRNSTTDPGPRISWASSNSAAIVLESVIPADCDITQNGSLVLLASMAGATDTPKITVACFAGVGGSNLGADTAAITGTTPTAYSIPITFPAASSQIVATLTPGAHTTDIMRLDAAYFTYTRI